MDKYKTAEVGKALKRVFRGEITVSDSIELAKSEILDVFNRPKNVPPEYDTDDGFFGDVAGKCPLCGASVTRTSFGYGCSGYKESGCRFGIKNVICSRVISLSNVRQLLSTGKTHKIEGFISPRTGKAFSAYLTLRDGRAEFDFGE